MRIITVLCGIFLFLFWAGDSFSEAPPPLGLPPVPIPEDNPQSPEKIALGEKLFEDKRFSADGTISCATCHDPTKAFTDHLPLPVAATGFRGIRWGSGPTGKKGRDQSWARNAVED